MATRRTLLLLVDSPSYIRENCYQHQLYETLADSFSVRMCSLRELRYNPFIRAKKFDVVLSVLKQRTLARHIDEVAKFLNGEPVTIYDQDPWQAFMDDSPTKGCYGDFAGKLNLRAILLTTGWWTQFCRSRGLPTRFVRMGMLPRYCDAGPDWATRPIGLGFQGTIHSHRKLFFDALDGMGLKVEVLPSGSYAGYLKTLHDIRIYIHTEDAPWMVDGELIPRNSLWIKDVEVAARGCFAIRNWDEDFDAYDLAELPTVKAFHRVEEIPAIVDAINTMDAGQRQDMVTETVARIKARDDWQTVVQALD